MRQVKHVGTALVMVAVDWCLGLEKEVDSGIVVAKTVLRIVQSHV